MNDIQVVDNFLNDEELYVAKEQSKKFAWEYGHSSGKNGIKFWACELINNDFYKNHVFKKIEKHFNKKFTLYHLYANGQTYAQDGDYHLDLYDGDPNKPLDNAYTFLLYISDITHDNVHIVDGYTFFKRGHEVTCVEPILNRGVLFKGNIWHKALAPSRSSNLLRISIAFKLREIK